MFILHDHRIPKEAKKMLSKWGELLPVESHDIVYESISGHPDIFFFRFHNQIVYAPQAPRNIVNKLHQSAYNLIPGSSSLGSVYPATVAYNGALVQEKLMGNMKYLDSKILDLFPEERRIHINQGYAACNMLSGNKLSLVSDHLMADKTTSIFFDPTEVRLWGQKHGFIGGTGGISQGRLFLLGALEHIQQAQSIRRFLDENELELTELYKGTLLDAGGIIFI
jgi:hypothetical protein